MKRHINRASLQQTLQKRLHASQYQHFVDWVEKIVEKNNALCKSSVEVFYYKGTRYPTYKMGSFKEPTPSLHEELHPEMERYLADYAVFVYQEMAGANAYIGAVVAKYFPDLEGLLSCIPFILRKSVLEEYGLSIQTVDDPGIEEVGQRLLIAQANTDAFKLCILRLMLES